MRLAAIYIPQGVLNYVFGADHQGYTLNLGGKYNYSFKESKNRIELIEKKLNSSFIENFWGKNFNLVSSIVGANGTGKSSILNIFRNKSFCYYIYEIEDGDEIKIVEETNNINDIIYYTPFLNIENHNYINGNFKDVSKYQQIIEDTEYENMELSAQLELHNSENLKRWVKFRQLQNIESHLKDILLPTFNKIVIKINFFIPKVHDTPYAFRSFFEIFKNLKDNELNQRLDKLISLNPEFTDENRPRLFGNKIKLELEIIERIIYKTQNILEASGNKYLNEGFVNNDLKIHNEQFAQIKTLKESFYWFIENAYISLSKVNDPIRFPAKEIKDLIEELIFHIPETDNEIENWTEFSVSFENSLKIIRVYEKFIISFKEHFSFDRKILLTFRPNKNLSSGEKGVYNLFATLNEYQFKVDQGILEEFNSFSRRETHSDNYLMLLDEADMGFHPLWKRRFISSILDIFSIIFPNKKLQIIFTTHDPLTLSDLPKNNIVYLTKDQNNNTIVLEDHQQKSFGANVHDLLADSFFLKDGFMGKFAEEWILDLINYLTPTNEKTRSLNLNKKEKRIWSEELAKKVMNIIDEPIIKERCQELFNEKFLNNDRQMLERELKSIQAKIKRLDNEEN